MNAFNFHRVCAAHGLIEDETSLHAAECIHLGLDPKATSIHALRCVRHGLDPDKTSFDAYYRLTGETA